MVGGDPFLVVRLRSSGHSGAVGASNGYAFVGCALLSCTTLDTVAAAPLLGKVWRNPNGVEEVDNANKAGEDEKVEKDASHPGKLQYLTYNYQRQSELTFEGRRCSCPAQRC